MHKLMGLIFLIEYKFDFAETVIIDLATSRSWLDHHKVLSADRELSRMYTKGYSIFM